MINFELTIKHLPRITVRVLIHSKDYTYIILCKLWSTALLIRKKTVFSCERAVKKEATAEMILSTKQKKRSESLRKIDKLFEVVPFKHVICMLAVAG